MRVLHINSTIVVYSGVMSVLMNYYRHIDKDKIQFDFLYFSVSKFQYETYEQEIKKLGGQVFLIDKFSHIRTFNRKLADLIEKNHYKTVHIHDPFTVRFIYKTLRRAGVQNIIVHSHSTRWSDKIISAIRNKICCLNLVNKVDFCFACSLDSGDFLYGNKPFYIMHNAIDLDKYAFNAQIRKKIRTELGLNEKIVFGHVGSFCAQKNHSFLLNVFYEILKMHDAVLVLVGDGKLRAEIEKKINVYNIKDKVMVLGNRTNVEEYYQAMDCLIFPSLFEGLPMVGVEAQCAGLPVLFSDAITKEVGADFSAYLSLDTALGEWAQKAIELANQNFNRFLGKQAMAERGFDIIRETEKVQSKYLELEYV